MNVKKMFASLAGVLMLAQVVAPMVTGAATYSDELQGAYDYAYSQGITTMSSIDNANMYWDLTRGQLSKMISQWAEKEMGVAVDETAVCSFTDTDKAEGDLGTYVVKACKMGLMGQGIEKFRPGDKVTRGEFGTVLSRAIWGDKYNSENPFYAKHLQALKDAGIMNNISDPNATEMRGWVMLMLQRAAENVNPSECNDPAVLLACSLGSDSCPAACQKKADEENSDTENKDSNRVIAGDLDISVVDYSSSVQSAPVGIFVANTLKFNASEKIQLDSLTLKRTGLGTSKAISKVWLEKDGVAVTNSASVGSDGLAVLNFKSNRDTISEATEYQLAVELDTTNAKVWDEFAFELKSAESTAKNTKISGTTSTYRVSNYTVVSLTARPNAWNNGVAIAYDLGNNKDYIIWEFSLESNSKNDDRDIFVKSLTFRNVAGNALDFDDTFKNVVVYRDSKVVSKKVEVNGKDITISLDEDTIKANRKAIYTIRAEVKALEDVNKSVQLQLENTRDIIADEQDTSFRTTIAFKDSTDTTVNKLKLNEYKFKGGKVTLESASNFAKTVNAAKGASDVTVAKGRLNVTEPVELPTITLDLQAANPWITPISDVVKRLVLKVGDKRYSSDINAAGTTAGKAIFSDVTVRESADIELLVSLQSNPGAVTEFEIPDIKGSLMDNDGSYQNNDATLEGGDIAWVLQVAKVQIKTPKFTLTTESISKQETVINDSTVKTLMKGTLQAKENDVNVNKLTVTLGGDLVGTTTATATTVAGDVGKDLDIALTSSTKVISVTKDGVDLALTTDYTVAGNTVTVKSAHNTVAGIKYVVTYYTTSLTSPSVEAYLYINGKAFSNGKLANNQKAYSFNSLGTIKVGENMPFEIKVVPTIDTVQDIYLTVQAEGTDANGNETVTSSESSATLTVKGESTLDFTNTSSSDRVSDVTNNVVIYEGTLNVENGSTVLSNLNFTYNNLDPNYVALSNAKLVIDDETVSSIKATATPHWKIGGTQTILDFDSAISSTDGVALSENLTEGKHKVVVKADVTAKTNAVGDENEYLLTVTAVKNWTKTLSTSNVKTYFAKGWFKLSKTSTSDGVLTVKLTNTSNKTVKVTGITVNTAKANIATASINNQNVDFDNSTKAVWTVTSEQSVGAGESIEIQLIAADKQTAKLIGVSYVVTDSSTNYYYALTDAISSVGAWWNFFSSK